VDNELNAWRLLNDAWNHFWKHCPDPGAYYGDYMENEDLDEALTRAGQILSEGQHAAR
jgi:hypothetical protein